MPVHTVLFHRLASTEYLAARRRYARQSEKVAQSFEDEVERATRAIADNPSQWPIYRGSRRWVRTRRFSYLLVFEIIDDSRVLVVAVAHSRRRPGYW